MRPLRSIPIKALITCLACSASAQAAGDELWFRKAEKVALARGIQRDGFSCPEVKAVYFVEAKPDGNHMRAVCGTADEAATSSSFRLTVRGSGTYRVAPWSDGKLFTDVAQFASDFSLRTSLN